MSTLYFTPNFLILIKRRVYFKDVFISIGFFYFRHHEEDYRFFEKYHHGGDDYPYENEMRSHSSRNHLDNKPILACKKSFINDNDAHNYDAPIDCADEGANEEKQPKGGRHEMLMNSEFKEIRKLLNDDGQFHNNKGYENPHEHFHNEYNLNKDYDNQDYDSLANENPTHHPSRFGHHQPVYNDEEGQNEMNFQHGNQQMRFTHNHEEEEPHSEALSPGDSMLPDSYKEEERKMVEGKIDKETSNLASMYSHAAARADQKQQPHITNYVQKNLPKIDGAITNNGRMGDFVNRLSAEDGLDAEKRNKVVSDKLGSNKEDNKRTKKKTIVHDKPAAKRNMVPKERTPRRKHHQKKRGHHKKRHHTKTKKASKKFLIEIPLSPRTKQRRITQIRVSKQDPLLSIDNRGQIFQKMVEPKKPANLAINSNGEIVSVRKSGNGNHPIYHRVARLYGAEPHVKQLKHSLLAMDHSGHIYRTLVKDPQLPGSPSAFVQNGYTNEIPENVETLPVQRRSKAAVKSIKAKEVVHVRSLHYKNSLPHTQFTSYTGAKPKTVPMGTVIGAERQPLRSVSQAASDGLQESPEEESIAFTSNIVDKAYQNEEGSRENDANFALKEAEINGQKDDPIGLPYIPGEPQQSIQMAKNIPSEQTIESFSDNKVAEAVPIEDQQNEMESGNMNKEMLESPNVSRENADVKDTGEVEQFSRNENNEVDSYLNETDIRDALRKSHTTPKDIAKIVEVDEDTADRMEKYNNIEPGEEDEREITPAVAPVYNKEKHGGSNAPLSYSHHKTQGNNHLRIMDLPQDKLAGEIRHHVRTPSKKLVHDQVHLPEVGSNEKSDYLAPQGFNDLNDANMNEIARDLSDTLTKHRKPMKVEHVTKARPSKVSTLHPSEKDEEDPVTRQITKEENAVQSLFGQIANNHKDQASTEEEFLEKIIPLTGTAWGLGSKRGKFPATKEKKRVDENALERSTILKVANSTKSAKKQNKTHSADNKQQRRKLRKNSSSATRVSGDKKTAIKHRHRQHHKLVDDKGAKKSVIYGKMAPESTLSDEDNEVTDDESNEEIPEVDDIKTENARKKEELGEAEENKPKDDGEKYVLVGKLVDVQKKSENYEASGEETPSNPDAVGETNVNFDNSTDEGSAESNDAVSPDNKSVVNNSTAPVVDDPDDADDYDDNDDKDDEEEAIAQPTQNKEKESLKVPGETDGKQNEGYVVMGKMVEFDQNKASELDKLAHDFVMHNNKNFKDIISQESGAISHLYGNYVSRSNTSDRNLEEHFLDKVIPLTQTTWELNRRHTIQKHNTSTPSKRTVKHQHENASDGKAEKRYLPLPNFSSLKEHIHNHEPIYSSYHDHDTPHHDGDDEGEGHAVHRDGPSYEDDYEPFNHDKGSDFHDDHDDHGDHDDHDDHRPHGHEFFHEPEHDQEYHEHDYGDPEHYHEHDEGYHDKPEHEHEHEEFHHEPEHHEPIQDNVIHHFHNDSGQEEHPYSREHNPAPTFHEDAHHNIDAGQMSDNGQVGDTDGLPAGYREQEHKALDNRIQNQENKLQNLFGEISRHTHDDRDTEKVFLEQALKLTGTPWGLEGRKQKVPIKKTNVQNRTMTSETKKNIISNSTGVKRAFHSPDDEYSMIKQDHRVPYFHNESDHYEDEGGDNEFRRPKNEYGEYHQNRNDDDGEGENREHDGHHSMSNMDSDGLPQDYKEAEDKALSSKVHREEDNLHNLFGDIAKSARNNKDMESIFLQKAIKLADTPWDSKKKHKIPLNDTVNTQISKRNYVSPTPQVFKTSKNDTSKKEKIRKIFEDSKEKLPEKLLLDADNAQLGGSPLKNGEIVFMGKAGKNENKTLELQEQQVNIPEQTAQMVGSGSGEKSETEGSATSSGGSANGKEEKTPPIKSADDALVAINGEDDSSNVIKEESKAVGPSKIDDQTTVLKVPSEASGSHSGDNKESETTISVSSNNDTLKLQPSRSEDKYKENSKLDTSLQKPNNSIDDNSNFSNRDETFKPSPNHKNDSDESWDDRPHHSTRHMNNNDDDDDDNKARNNDNDDDDDFDDNGGDSRNTNKNSNKEEDENGLPMNWVKEISKQTEKAAENKVRNKFNDKMYESSPNPQRERDDSSRYEEEEGDRMHNVPNQNNYNNLNEYANEQLEPQPQRMNSRFRNNSDGGDFDGNNRLYKNHSGFRNESDDNIDCDVSPEKCSVIADKLTGKNDTLEDDGDNEVDTPPINNHPSRFNNSEPDSDAEGEYKVDKVTENTAGEGIVKVNPTNSDITDDLHTHGKIISPEERQLLADKLLETYQERTQDDMNTVLEDGKDLIGSYFNSRRIDNKEDDEYQKLKCPPAGELKKNHIDKTHYVDCSKLRKRGAKKMGRMKKQHAPRVKHAPRVEQHAKKQHRKSHSGKKHAQVHVMHNKKAHAYKKPVYDMDMDQAFTKEIIRMAQTDYGFNKKHLVPKKTRHYNETARKKHILQKPNEDNKKTRISSFHMKVSNKRIKKNHHVLTRNNDFVKSIIPHRHKKSQVRRPKTLNRQVNGQVRRLKKVRGHKRSRVLKKKSHVIGSKRSDVGVEHKLKVQRRKEKSRLVKKELEYLKAKLSRLGNEVSKLEKQESKRNIIHMIKEYIDSTQVHIKRSKKIKGRLKREVVSSPSNSSANTSIASGSEANLTNSSNSSGKADLKNSSNVDTFSKSIPESKKLTVGNESMEVNNSTVNVTSGGHRRKDIHKYHRNQFNHPVSSENRPDSAYLARDRESTPFHDKDYSPHFNLFPDDNKVSETNGGEHFAPHSREGGLERGDSNEYGNYDSNKAFHNRYGNSEVNQFYQPKYDNDESDGFNQWHSQHKVPDRKQVDTQDDTAVNELTATPQRYEKQSNFPEPRVDDSGEYIVQNYKPKLSGNIDMLSKKHHANVLNDEIHYLKNTVDESNKLTSQYGDNPLDYSPHVENVHHSDNNHHYNDTEEGKEGMYNRENIDGLEHKQGNYSEGNEGDVYEEEGELAADKNYAEKQGEDYANDETLNTPHSPYIVSNHIVENQEGNAPYLTKQSNEIVANTNNKGLKNISNSESEDLLESNIRQGANSEENAVKEDFNPQVKGQVIQQAFDSSRQDETSIQEPTAPIDTQERLTYDQKVQQEGSLQEGEPALEDCTVTGTAKRCISSAPVKTVKTEEQPALVQATTDAEEHQNGEEGTLEQDVESPEEVYNSVVGAGSMKSRAVVAPQHHAVYTTNHNTMKGNAIHLSLDSAGNVVDGQPEQQIVNQQQVVNQQLPAQRPHKYILQQKIAAPANSQNIASDVEGNAVVNQPLTTTEEREGNTVDNVKYVQSVQNPVVQQATQSNIYNGVKSIHIKQHQINVPIARPLVHQPVRVVHVPVHQKTVRLVRPQLVHNRLTATSGIFKNNVNSVVQSPVAHRVKHVRRVIKRKPFQVVHHTVRRHQKVLKKVHPANVNKAATPSNFQDDEIGVLDNLAGNEESKLKNLFGYVSQRQKDPRLTEETFLEVASNLTGTPWGLGKIELFSKPCVTSEGNQGGCLEQQDSENNQGEKRANVARREIDDDVPKSNIQNKSMSHLLEVLGLVEKTHTEENADGGNLIGKVSPEALLPEEDKHAGEAPAVKRFHPQYHSFEESDYPYNEQKHFSDYNKPRNSSDEDDFERPGEDFHPKQFHEEDSPSFGEHNPAEEIKAAVPPVDVDGDGLPKGYRDEEHKDLTSRITKESSQLQHLFKDISFNSKDSRESERLFLEKVIPLTGTSWGLSNRKHEVPDKKEATVKKNEKRTLTNGAILNTITAEDNTMVHTAMTNTSDLFMPAVEPAQHEQALYPSVPAAIKNTTEFFNEPPIDSSNVTVVNVDTNLPIRRVNNIFNDDYNDQTLVDGNAELVDNQVNLEIPQTITEPQTVVSPQAHKVHKVHLAPPNLLENPTGYVDQSLTPDESGYTHPVHYKVTTKELTATVVVPNQVPPQRVVNAEAQPTIVPPVNVPQVPPTQVRVPQRVVSAHAQQARVPQAHHVRVHQGVASRQSALHVNSHSRHDIHDVTPGLDDDDSPHDMHSTGADELDYESPSPSYLGAVRHEIQVKKVSAKKIAAVAAAMKIKGAQPPSAAAPASRSTDDYIDGGGAVVGSNADTSQQFLDDDMRHDDDVEDKMNQFDQMNAEDVGQTLSKKSKRGRHNHKTKRSFDNLQIPRNETQYARSDIRYGESVDNDTLVSNGETDITMDENGRSKMSGTSGSNENENDEEDNTSSEDVTNERPMHPSASVKAINPAAQAVTHTTNDTENDEKEGAQNDGDKEAFDETKDSENTQLADDDIGQKVIVHRGTKSKTYRKEAGTRIPSRKSQTHSKASTRSYNAHENHPHRIRMQPKRFQNRHQIEENEMLNNNEENEENADEEANIIKDEQNIDDDGNARVVIQNTRHHVRMNGKIRGRKILEQRRPVNYERDDDDEEKDMINEQQKNGGRQRYIESRFINEDHDNRHYANEEEDEEENAADDGTDSDGDLGDGPAKVIDASTEYDENGNLVEEQKNQPDPQNMNDQEQFITSSDLRRVNQKYVVNQKVRNSGLREVQDVGRRQQLIRRQHHNQYNRPNLVMNHNRGFMKKVHHVDDEGVASVTSNDTAPPYYSNNIDDYVSKIMPNRTANGEADDENEHVVVNRMQTAPRRNPRVIVRNRNEVRHQTEVENDAGGEMDNQRDEVADQNNENEIPVDDRRNNTLNSTGSMDESTLQNDTNNDSMEISNELNDLNDPNEEVNDMNNANNQPIENDDNSEDNIESQSPPNNVRILRRIDASRRNVHPTLHRKYIRPNLVSKKTVLDDSARKGVNEPVNHVIVKTFTGNRKRYHHNIRPVNRGRTHQEFANIGRKYNRFHSNGRLEGYPQRHQKGESRHINPQKWSGYSKDHPKIMNQEFVESLIPNKIKHLETLRVTHKVNKETRELQKLFNNIVDHQERGPEERFIGEASRLIASKWGLNGDLGYKVQYPPAMQHGKNEFHKVVVNLNQTLPNRNHSSDSNSNDYDGYKRSVHLKTFVDPDEEGDAISNSQSSSDSGKISSAEKKDLVFNKFGVAGRYSHNGELTIANDIDVDTPQETMKGQI